MIPRAAAEIFSHIAQDTRHEYSVCLSYIQIYMELIQVELGGGGDFFNQGMDGRQRTVA